MPSTNDSGKTVEEGPKISDLRDLADGETDKEYEIEGEFIENGYNDNTLSHQRGVISMYRKTYSQYQQEMAMLQMTGYASYADTLLTEFYDSQSAGFFILTADETGFDGTYTAFGKVIEGMDVVDAISKVELQKSTDDGGNETTTTKPVTAPVIKTVTVDTDGVDYGMPEIKDVFDFDSVFNLVMQNYMQSSGTTSSY